MDRQALISVIVVNWNGRQFLKPCLDSLLAQTYPYREMIVVDNGSTDGSVQLLKAAYGERITIIEQDRNYGFAKAVNRGIQAARGACIALLNNDAIASPQWLAELVGGFLGDPMVGMCACKVLFCLETQRINSAGNLLYPDGISARRGFGELDTGQYERVEETLFPDGSAALYRRAMLDDVGAFDEQFFLYSEDTDLGLRGRLFGWTCLYVPTAAVYHVHSGTVNQLLTQKAFFVERNHCWLAVKLFPLPLLVLSPLFTLIRFVWNVRSVVSQKGSAGRFSAQYSKWTLVLILAKAYLAAFRGLPAMVKKRRAIRRTKRLSDWEFIRLVYRFRVSAKELTLRDR